MRIGGFQKVTLIDYPGKIACTIFIHGCNFRCGFCHNPELVISQNGREISQEEILEYLSKRKKFLDGVCISGGEPLMNLDKEFLIKIKELGFAIKIDTNGSFPEKLDELIDEKLIDFVALDIKASKESYEKVASCNVDLGKIEKTIDIITSRNIEHEFRTTVVEETHDEEEMKKIGNWISEMVGYKVKRFVLQGFKNNEKFIDDRFKNKKDTSKEHLEKLKEVMKDFAEDVEVRV